MSRPRTNRGQDGVASMATVLVVDDEFGIAELIDAVLTDEGYRVVSAANGREGLEMLIREQPDMVFLEALLGFQGGGCWSRDEGCDESPEEGCASLPRVVHELEEAEIVRQLVLRDAAMRAKPGAQQ